MNRQNLFAKIFFASLVIAGLSSCHEKGCTDKNAINYNVAADQDDGSCIVCKTTVNNIGEESSFLIDENWGSPHYNQVVAKFNVSQDRSTPNNQICGTGTNTLGLKIESLVSEKMSFSYHVYSYNGPLYFNYNNSVSVDGHATSDEGVIYTITDGSTNEITDDSVAAYTVSDIIYF